MNIIEALKELDVLNDDHWTADGAPRIDAVGNLLGDFKVARKDIIEAAPKFDRTHPFKDGQEQEAEIEGDGSGESLPEIKEDEKDKLEELVTKIKQEELVDVPIFNGGEAVQEFMKTLKKVSKEEAAGFVIEVRKELTLVHRELENAQIKARAVKKMLDLAKSHALTIDPNTSDGQAIRDYINSQNEARLKRVTRSNSVLKGIRIKDLLPKSPLDTAMSIRKPARGSQRPVR